VIVGDGPLRRELQKQAAGVDVTFTGKLNGERLRKAYAEARALIFPGTEDFGIVPVEAQAAGTPVIAFGCGGALETVVPGKTGVFFNEDNVGSLVDAIEEFTGLCFDFADLKANAVKFNAERFRDEVSSLLTNMDFNY
jgi:glycosyltransferase involved in cell wall biosynthesis